MNTFKSRIALLLIGFGLLFGPVGCKKDSTDTTVTPQNQPSVLVSGTSLGKFTPAQLTNRYTALFGSFASLITGQYLKNEITIYKIVYKTTNTDGTAIQASGALIVPTTSGAVPMISLQHGTIRSNDDAPSGNGTGSDTYSFGALFASSGYIVTLPDYIGYGTSASLPHSYEHRAGLATASLDMLRASREFLDQNKVNWDKRLYLTGYSEGGYATMSLFKKMQDDAPTEFNLKAVSCGAGAYDKTAFMKSVVSNTTTTDGASTSLYIWVLLTYDRIYGLNRPMSYYFKEPYATQIQAQRENIRLTVSLNQVFTDAFKQAVTTGTDAAFVKAVADNDVFDWKPNTPLQLYHGTGDKLVPFFNSQNAFDAMKKRGTANVTLTPIQGADHTSTDAVTGYGLGTYSFFQSVQ
jgi:dienelactone hydrolase